MYTDPLHINVNDPGHVEGNVVFMYLDALCNDNHFSKYLPEYKNLDELKKHYKHGGLGDFKIKKFLINVIEDILEPIRIKRKEYENNIPEIVDILKKGTEEANIYANKTLSEVKKAIGIDYFNEEFINEQIKKFKDK